MRRSILLLFSVFVVLLPRPAAAGILDSIRDAAHQSSLLARNAASKIIEKAGEYGYDDLDILVRFGMGIKYPEGIEVRRLDASLALLDLALTATDKGILYVNLLFRHRLGRWFIECIPYLTGRDSLYGLLLGRLRREVRNYLENYQFGVFLTGPPSDHDHAGNPGSLPPLRELPRPPGDVRAVRQTIRDLQRGIRHFHDELSGALHEKVSAAFPEMHQGMPAQLLRDLTSGRILVTLVEMLARNQEEFLRLHQELSAGAEFVRACHQTAHDENQARILLSIPRNLQEMTEFNNFIKRLPDAVSLVARHGRAYYQRIQQASPVQFQRIRPLGEQLLPLVQRFGEPGLRFVFRYGGDAAELLFFMNRPSSYVKRRLRMFSFFLRHGVGTFPWMFRLKLLSPLEPIILGSLFLLFLFVVVYFHISGYLVWSVFVALPGRQKLAVTLVLLLFFAAFYWTLVENARLLIEGDARPRPVVYHKVPTVTLEPSGLFATSLHALESAEVEFQRLQAAGAHFRTAEVELFRRHLQNLQSSFTAQLESFEVRLISEPKLYENYGTEKIIGEGDLLLDISVSIRNLDSQPRLFPLSIELSSVMGNLISPVQGHQRLMKTTFNPGVRDLFTLSFPIRLEDRPDRLVIKKEFLLNTREKFISFGPGTPLRIGDILPTRDGLVYFRSLQSLDTCSVALNLIVLSSYDATRETELFGTDSSSRTNVFLVSSDDRLIAPVAQEGNWPGFPELIPNRLLEFRLRYTAETEIGKGAIRFFVLNNKKILAEPYRQADEVERITRQYLRRIAAASEFDLGMYYLNPPLYRRWARDVDEAGRHFERAEELLPGFPLIRDALHLTGANQAPPAPDTDGKTASPTGQGNVGEPAVKRP